MIYQINIRKEDFMKIKIGLFFGGNSVEHEISIISALQALQSIDKEKYDVVPIYISKKNEIRSTKASQNAL